MSLPKYTTALVLRESSKTPPYDDAVLVKRLLPPLKEGQILVKMGAVAFNHREVWIRKRQYPGVAFNSVFGADGAGTVVASAVPNDPLLNRRVFLTPMRGWESHPDAPESRFGIVGSGLYPDLGTFSEFVVVEHDQVLLSPDHLDDEHVAALPLASLTAWRAAIINGGVEKGHNVLVTGAGGGVALMAIQFCLAKGANVYVTSGSEAKIRKAVALGVKGGVIYKQKDWPSQLSKILGEALLDCVIDSAGGEILQQTSRVLKGGGKVVCYGMTSDSKIAFRMQHVLKNQQLIGSTMGSHKDLKDATFFISEHKIIPVVSHIIDGLENAEQGFESLKNGEQTGKIVIKIRTSHQTKL